MLFLKSISQISIKNAQVFLTDVTANLVSRFHLLSHSRGEEGQE